MFGRPWAKSPSSWLPAAFKKSVELSGFFALPTRSSLGRTLPIVRYVQISIVRYLCQFNRLRKKKTIWKSMQPHSSTKSFFCEQWKKKPPVAGEFLCWVVHPLSLSQLHSTTAKFISTTAQVYFFQTFNTADGCFKAMVKTQSGVDFGSSLDPGEFQVGSLPPCGMRRPAGPDSNILISRGLHPNKLGSAGSKGMAVFVHLIWHFNTSLFRWMKSFFRSVRVLNYQMTQMTQQTIREIWKDQREDAIPRCRRKAGGNKPPSVIPTVVSDKEEDPIQEIQIVLVFAAHPR